LVQIIVISFVALIAMGIAHISFLIKDYKKGIFALNIIFVIANTGLFVHYGFPIVSQGKSIKRLALKLNQILPPGEKIVFYDHIRESAIFYSGRQGRVVDSEEELEDYLASKKQVYCLIRQKDYNKLKGYLDIQFYIIDREGKFFLISNNPL